MYSAVKYFVNNVYENNSCYPQFTVLQHSAMRRRLTTGRKDQQVNIRFTQAEIDALQYIADFEDRDCSYLIRWFTHWGTELWRKAGSLSALKATKFITGEQTVIQGQVKESAENRLELRKGAQESLDAQHDQHQFRHKRA